MTSAVEVKKAPVPELHKPDLLITDKDGKQQINPEAVFYMHNTKKISDEQKLVQTYRRVGDLLGDGDDKHFTKQDFGHLLVLINNGIHVIAEEFFPELQASSSGDDDSIVFPTAKQLSDEMDRAKMLPSQDKFKLLFSACMNTGMMMIAHAYWTRHYSGVDKFDEITWCHTLREILGITPHLLQFILNVGKIHYSVHFPNKKHYLDAVPKLTAIKNEQAKDAAPLGVVRDANGKTEAQKARKKRKQATYKSKKTQTVNVVETVVA